MDRRTFITGMTGGLLAAPLVGAVEPVRIGVPSSDAEILSHLLKAFRDRLGELSYVDGQNLAIEYRFAQERLARLPDLAAELIGLGVGVIIAVGPARGLGISPLSVPGLWPV